MKKKNSMLANIVSQTPRLVYVGENYWSQSVTVGVPNSAAGNEKKTAGATHRVLHITLG